MIRLRSPPGPRSARSAASAASSPASRCSRSIPARLADVGANTLATSASCCCRAPARHGHTRRAHEPDHGGLGTLVAATTGRIEVGTAGTAHAGQIVVDAAHTLISSGALSARVILNRGTITGAAATACSSSAPGAVTNSGTAALISARNTAFMRPPAWRPSSTRARSSARAGAGVYFGPGGTATNSGIPALDFRRAVGHRELWPALRRQPGHDHRHLRRWHSAHRWRRRDEQRLPPRASPAPVRPAARSYGRSPGLDHSSTRAPSSPPRPRVSAPISPLAAR